MGRLIFWSGPIFGIALNLALGSLVNFLSAIFICGMVGGCMFVESLSGKRFF